MDFDNFREHYEGDIYHTEKYGDYRVLRELIGIGYKDRVFEIEFLNTGYKTFVTRGTMISGGVRDRFVPSVYGIGCIGNTYFISGPDVSILYKIWSGIVERCYNERKSNPHQYQIYGGAGVRMSEDWLLFTNFYKDVKKLHGYDKKLQYPDIFQLDKDYLQRDLPKEQRVYSKETCLWLSIHENNLVKGRDNNKYVRFFGVRYIHDTGYYYTKIYRKCYGKFRTPEEAACMFNYIYPLVCIKEYSTVPMINEVPMIPFEELQKNNLLTKRDNLDILLNNHDLSSSTTNWRNPE